MVIHIDYLPLRCLINPTESHSKQRRRAGAGWLGWFYPPVTTPRPQAEMKGQWPEYKGKEGSFFTEGDDKEENGER